MFESNSRIIELQGISVPVDPDFRIMCSFGAAHIRKDADMMIKSADNFYFSGLPEGVSPELAAEGMVDFYCRGMKCRRNSYSDKTIIPTFDFEEDEAFFYAAFLENYRIDLMSAKLHWFDFCRLFLGLPDDCRLRQIIGIRSAELSKIKCKSEKARIAQLKELYALEAVKNIKPRTSEERNTAMHERILAMHKKARERRDYSGK